MVRRSPTKPRTITILTRKARFSSSRDGSVIVKRIPVTKSVASAIHTHGMKYDTIAARGCAPIEAPSSLLPVIATAVRTTAMLRMCTVCTRGTNHFRSWNVWLLGVAASQSQNAEITNCPRPPVFDNDYLAALHHEQQGNCNRTRFPH